MYHRDYNIALATILVKTGWVALVTGGSDHPLKTSEQGT